jgi:NAD(P)-dependent dehydrogenase (short-subunit alcohol dehydrogenase family)
MGRLEGKVVVILGASDVRSMGAATAKRLAAEGARLVLAARRVEQLKPIAASVDGIAVQCDITREDDLANLARVAKDKFGKLDVAINYAGVNSSAAISEVTREMLLAVCEVHFIGSVLFFKHMAAQMTSGGSLVTTSSLTALTAPPGLAAYAGTKRGVDQVVRIAAVEYGPKGIRVNAIAPGFTRSAMTDGYFAIPTLEGAFLREIPLGRLPTVTDVANAALWLASDEAFVTGQVIDVTGGQSLRRIPTSDEMMKG